MSSPRIRDADEIIPPKVAAAGGVLIIAVLAVTAFATFSAPPRQPGAPVTEAEVVATRDIAFRDTAGGLAVWDVTAGRAIATFGPDEGGFIRGMERVLAFERSKRANVPALPFRLTAHADGRIAIEDLATGHVIDINAFGPDNAEAFAALL